MAVILQRDEYTNKWILPGEVWKRAGGGNCTSGVHRVITYYDVHDAMGFRIHRAWKDNIVGYDATPLRRPTLAFRQIEAYWHPNVYGSGDTRHGCRRFLANWLAGDCGKEVDVMRAIMDQIPFVPETYMKWVIENEAPLFQICSNKTGALDRLLPPYVPRTVPNTNTLRGALRP
jgi:hypothetical protein